jgi:flagellar biosynthesis activator protein FlaF
MSKSAAQAYSRVANSTASPRDIEAQALLMAANKLQDVMTRSDATVEQTEQALMFNRKLWTVFIGEALSDTNPQPIEVRQKIANIAIFVLSQTLALQAVPQLDQFKSLIDINRNIAAGLSGRA